jgi:hypothetical protein
MQLLEQDFIESRLTSDFNWSKKINKKYNNHIRTQKVHLLERKGRED